MSSEGYIKVVSRYDPRFFVDRTIRIASMGEDLKIEGDITYISVPYDLIVCDYCNKKITTPAVNLLMLGGSLWGTLCEECRLKGYSDLVVVKDIQEREVAERETIMR